MARSIMLQGTASDVGKSVLAAGLCRIFLQDGYRVAPFKSQNMALNSGITLSGDEMGRAQIFQAEAAGIAPDVRMNPVLLKPTGERKSQVIVMGKVLSDMDAVTYHQFKPQLMKQVLTSYDSLSDQFQVIVIEGAGSPAEINLRDRDIVNMGLAERIDAPVILVADIDRGGVFASIYGTLALLHESERQRVKGVIINKFRGDPALLTSGIEEIERLTEVPILGVMPMIELYIEDEDGVALDKPRNYRRRAEDELDIAVIQLPHISNFTDFNPLVQQPDVRLRYVKRGQTIGNADLVIIPGSKNTLVDLSYLHQSGLAAEIQDLARNGTAVIGICGGYQMLCQTIYDGIESGIDQMDGLGLLPCETHFSAVKTTTQVNGHIIAPPVGLFSQCRDIRFSGYEIHMGQTTRNAGAAEFSRLSVNGQSSDHSDGAVSDDGNIMGTYVHGIFDEGSFARALLNALRQRKGWPPLDFQLSFAAFKQGEYDRLAQAMRDHLDIERIYQIMALSE
jgi:adenosylcobyric acid synthase